MRETITCEQAREGLREYLDDAAPPGSAESTRRHLDACLECSRHLRELQRTRDLLAALPGTAMPPVMKATLLAALRRHPPA